MTIQDVIAAVRNQELPAFRRKIWERDNSFVVVRNDGSLHYYYYGNVRVGGWHADACDLLADDYEPMPKDAIGEGVA